jgi:hypothetical protein
MKQVDFPAYNVEMITPRDPVTLNVTWCFRRGLRADKYGFVFRLWPTKGEIDNSNVRVLWLDRTEFRQAIGQSVLRVPPIGGLPEFPKDDLASLSGAAVRER